MPDEYTVKINRREGTVEIAGPDKDWITALLERLSPVYEDMPSVAQPMPKRGSGNTRGGKSSLQRKAGPRKPHSNEGEGAGRRRARAGSFKRNEELAGRLSPEVRTKLAAYIEERRPNFTKGPNQAVIIASFLKTELDWEVITANDLYTVFTVMGMAGPNPKNALDDAKRRDNYFTGSGQYQLSFAGERFGHHDAKANVAPAD